MSPLIRTLRRLTGLVPVSVRRRKSRPAVSPEPLEARQLFAVDLAIQSARLTHVDTSIPNRLEFSLQVVVVNLGDTPVDVAGNLADSGDNVTLQLFESIDAVFGGGDPAAGVDVVRPDPFSLVLQPNGSVRRGLEGLAENFPASQFILIQVDGGNTVAESNEDNNFFALSLSHPYLVGDEDGEVPRRKAEPVDRSMQVIDLDTADFNGSELVVTNLTPEISDQFRFLKTGEGANRLRAAGGKLKLGKQVLGTLTGGKKGGPLQISLTSPVDHLLFNRILGKIAFRGKHNDPPERSIRFDLKDPAGLSSPPFFVQLAII